MMHLVAFLCAIPALTTAWPYVVNEKYTMSNSNYTFIDVNGELSDILEYEIEILVRGLGFGEGPKWIQDCDYINDGYMLVADQYNNCIFKYWAVNESTYDIECIREFPNEKPNGIGWNLNYPNELFVALQDGHATVRINFTDGNLTELNRWSETSDGIKIYGVNDVIEDSQGNAYFSNFPAFADASLNITSGTWTINRDTMEASMIEQLNYGTNGIAMTLDETLMVVAVTQDYPTGTFNGADSTQANFSRLFWRGYENSGSINDDNNEFSSDNAFYYLTVNNALTYFNSLNAHDGSAFDFEDNYWQSLIDGSSAEGYALITNAVKYGNNNSAIIGIINFTDTGHGPTNFAKGMDGYMYVTLTQWNNGGWGSGGVLARFKLKHYLTNENNGSTSDYVLDCGYGTNGNSDDSAAFMIQSCQTVVIVAVLLLLAVFV